MINVARLHAEVDLVELVRRDGVELKRAGVEWEGLCPFHDERTPSFHVVPAKGFVHCFGCGVHYDAIGYVMARLGCTFIEACQKLGAADDVLAGAKRLLRTRPRALHEPPQELWVPVWPVPDDAPQWRPDEPGVVWNPKRHSAWRVAPSRADAYHDGDGALLGYVLRIEARDGRKLTPAVTWCIGSRGDARWCLVPFSTPRPLFGLDVLAAKPTAPVLVVEGEKCAVAGAGALPQYAVLAWPGGSKGVKHVDFSPVCGRDLVLWPDADEAGDQAMFGWADRSGRVHEGVAQSAWRAGAKSIRYVDTSGRPRGWDIADALQVDGWTPRQLAAWARTRVGAVQVFSRGLKCQHQ